MHVMHEVDKNNSAANYLYRTKEKKQRVAPQYQRSLLVENIRNNYGCTTAGHYGHYRFRGKAPLFADDG